MHDNEIQKVGFDYGNVWSIVPDWVCRQIKGQLFAILRQTASEEAPRFFKCKWLKNKLVPFILFNFGKDQTRYEFTSEEYILERIQTAKKPPGFEPECYMAIRSKEDSSLNEWILSGVFAKRYAIKLQYSKGLQFGFGPSRKPSIL
uniref:AlNc14C313G10509 protein n=1 Tax=Albugo laibachii Nc14 TaxID=890382 RepID=F0WW67_9STRA|nr:AlNc14C313G10509 [Albugo laibachii Nc14]|eukprot:CCA25686.1 AlNc14C313G10509 [Albugo laibachii Nc14]